MEPLNDVPDTLTAGDSYALRLVEPDYPATAGWSLRLDFVGPDTLTVNSTATGDAHALALTSSATSPLAAGQYRFAIKAIRGIDVHTIRGGLTQLLPDLSAAFAGGLASFAERALAAVEAAILGAASDEMRMMMIDGRQLMKMSMDELMRARARFKAEVAAERGHFGVPIVMTVSGFSS